MAKEKEEVLEVGNCVKLKCGGPKMVIERICKQVSEKDSALCKWFDGNKPKSEWFSLEILEEVN